MIVRLVHHCAQFQSHVEKGRSMEVVASEKSPPTKLTWRSCLATACRNALDGAGRVKKMNLQM